jgi:hypothetical protein
VALTKTNVSIYSAQTSSVAIGSATAYDLDDSYETDVYVSLVQTGTATTAASIEVHISPDDSDYYRATVWSAGLTAATYQIVISVPSGKAVKIVYTAQSGGTSSSLTAELCKVTAI